jgi:hypothetical protein
MDDNAEPTRSASAGGKERSGADGGIDGRIEAVRQTIAHWDWRARIETTGSEPGNLPEPLPLAPSVPSASSPLTTPVPPRAPVVPPLSGDRPSPPPSADRTLMRPPPPSLTAAGAFVGTVPISVVGRPQPPIGFAMATEPKLDFEPGLGTSRPARRNVRIVALALLFAVLIAVAAFGIVRVVMGPSSGGPSPWTGAGHLTGSQRARFQQDLAELDRANQVASAGFAARGSHPSGKQLDRVASPYQTALDRYQSQIHVIGWPGSSQSALQVDTARLQALVAFLESSNLVTPSTSPKWLAQLHGRTQASQLADNALRESVGVPGATSFP